MLTAYDYPTAQAARRGRASRCCSSATRSAGRCSATRTRSRVSMADMLHHAEAVTRGARRALVVGDMPFLSYATTEAALENAGRFLPEAGAQAVKLEGGVRSARDDRGAREGRHPGDGPHRPDAAGGQRDRQGPRPGQERRAGPVRSSTTRSRSRRRAPSRSCWSSSRSSSPRRSPSACGSRRSGSGRGPAAAARSRSSRTCSASRRGSRSTPSPTPTCAATILDAARAYAADVDAGTFPAGADGPDGRRGARRGARPIGPRRVLRVIAGDVPVGGIPLDRDL